MEFCRGKGFSMEYAGFIWHQTMNNKWIDIRISIWSSILSSIGISTDRLITNFTNVFTGNSVWLFMRNDLIKHAIRDAVAEIKS